MATIAPSDVVDTPTVEAPRYGLLSVSIEIETGADPSWRNGVSWEPVACARAGSVGVDCTTDFGLPKTFMTQDDFTEGKPFSVYGSWGCGPIGSTVEEMRANATSHLIAGEQRELERVVWTGDRGNSPSFVDASTVNLTPGAAPGTPQTPERALGRLEEHLGDNYGSIGAIHVPLEGLPRLSDHVMQEGEVLRTLRGTYVAAGAGYSVNTGPDGSAAPADSVWMYATGRPVLRRSQPEVVPDGDGWLSMADNEATMLAERTYVVAWDCVTAAVLMALT